MLQVLSLAENTFYKHTFLIESSDEGRTWKNFRQLTTTLVQCYGFSVALKDGTDVVGSIPHSTDLATAAAEQPSTVPKENLVG